MNDGRVHLGLVLTGGTIGSVRVGDMVVIHVDDHTYNETRLVEDSWYGPGRLELHTRAPVRKLSEDLNPQDWLTIALTIRLLVEEDGVRDILVFHGTDTAAFTTAALSFLLSDLPATVVVTGSNIPAGAPNSDAPTNVGDALAAARLLSPGVYLSFSGVPGTPSEVHLGCAVRKAKAQGQAYESPNLGPIARIVNGELEMLRSWPRLRNQPQPQAMALDDRVAMVYLYPGIDLDMFADAIISTQKQGVILRLYASATGPDNPGRDSLSRFVKRCTDAGILVVATLERYVGSDSIYPSLIAIRDSGAIFAYDMIPEVAFVKLCWALAQPADAGSTRSLFLRPIAGESISAATEAERVEADVVESGASKLVH